MTTKRILFFHFLLTLIVSSDCVNNPTFNPTRCYNVHVDDFRAFVRGIWDADAPYRINPNGNNQGMTTNFQPLNDPNLQHFFTNPIADDRFNNVIYQSFAPLVAEDTEDDQQAHLFITSIIASDVGQRAIQLMPGMTEQNFRAGIYLLFFGDDWHIFKHVFRGERKTKVNRGRTTRTLTGYHNWYKFYTDERANNIEYLGSKDNNMVQLLQTRNDRHFFLGKYRTRAAPQFTKSTGTFFIGTSPAFEVVLYYYVHVHGCWGIPFFLTPALAAQPGERACIAGFYQNQWGQHPPTCFPVVETEQDSCKDHQMTLPPGAALPPLMTTTTTTPHPATTSTSTTTINPPEPPKEDGVGKYFQLVYKSIESFLERAKLFSSEVLKKLVEPMKKFEDEIHTEDDVAKDNGDDSKGGEGDSKGGNGDPPPDATSSRSETSGYEEGVEQAQ